MARYTSGECQNYVIMLIITALNVSELSRYAECHYAERHSARML